MHRDKVVELLDKIREAGMSDEKLVEEILYYWMPSDDAVECLDDIARNHELLD